MVLENTINGLKEKYGKYLKNVAVTGGGKGKGVKKITLIAWGIILPYILWNIVFWIYPNIVSIPIAFFETSLISAKAVFVGLDNFLDFFKREEFRMIMYNMFRFGIIYIPLSLIISMVLALMLNSVKNIP